MKSASQLHRLTQTGGTEFESAILPLIEQFPDTWPRALATLVDVFRSDLALLFTTKRSEVGTRFAVTTGLNDGDVPRFFSPSAAQLWQPWPFGEGPAVV
jgi:hypothetical protein